MTRDNYLGAAAAALLMLGGAAAADDATTQPTAPTSGTPHVLVVPSDVQWGPAPDSLPRGAQLAVIEGDPKAAGPFTMRLRFPDGYQIPPHVHPADEHVTVIDGTFQMAMGEQMDPAQMRALPVGGFAVMPQGTPHYAMARGDTTVQVHGMGPWGITYVNPTDDPRAGVGGAGPQQP